MDLLYDPSLLKISRLEFFPVLLIDYQRPIDRVSRNSTYFTCGLVGLNPGRQILRSIDLGKIQLKCPLLSDCGGLLGTSYHPLPIASPQKCQRQVFRRQPSKFQ